VLLPFIFGNNEKTSVFSLLFQKVIPYSFNSVNKALRSHLEFHQVVFMSSCHRNNESLTKLLYDGELGYLRDDVA
jgi:hypothetical protein